MKRNFFKLTFTSGLLLYSLHSFAESISELVPALEKHHGMLVFSVPVRIGELDPIITTNAHTKFTLPLIFESLITISPQQELQPVLAKSWSISKDGRSVIINIKPGHKFSDSSEVTAKDVYNSIMRLCSKGSHEYGELNGLAGCADHPKDNHMMPTMQMLGKYSIKFTIKNSPTTFLYQLSSPATVITKNSETGIIGSAPYRVDMINRDYTILSKNPYYAGNHTPKNDGIALFYAGGPDIMDTLNTSKPDGALMYRMQDISEFHDGNYKLIRSNPNITEILVLNNQRYPFNIPLVRKALANTIYNNFDSTCTSGSHQSYGVIPNGIGGSINNIAPSKLPDIKPATLFASVPSLKDHPATIILHQLSDLKSDCEAKKIIQACKRYNIDIQFKYHQDYADLLPLYQNHKLDGFLDLYVFKNREAYKVFEFFTTRGENDANIHDDKIDKLLTKASKTSSSHGRFQQYRELAQYMQDKNIIIPMFYMDHGNLVNHCISGISEDFYFNPFSFLPQLSKSNNCHHLEGMTQHVK